MHSVEKMPRPVRRRLRRVAQKSADRDYVRRAQLFIDGARCLKTMVRADLNRWPVVAASGRPTRPS